MGCLGSASEMDCNRSLLEWDLSSPLSEFMGLVRYRTVQKHAFPGPPRPKSVRIASCAHPIMPGRSTILEIALRRRILRHTVPSRLSYAWGVLRRWTATAAFSNGTLALHCLNSWAWCGTEPYRSMLSQAHPVPRAFGLPVVRIQSCLAVPPFWNQQGPGFWP